MPYSYAHNHYHLSRMREMGRIYWCHSIGSAGISLAAIFIPIFLLKTSYSMQSVLFYLLMQQLLAAVLQYPAGYLFRYVKPHKLLVIGNLWYAVLFGLLITLPAHHWPLFWLALAWALTRTIYWAAFHYCFGMARAHKHPARQIAGINALVMFSTTAAPAIGGVAATALGIKYVYAAAIVMIGVAVAPMMWGAEGPARTVISINWHDIWTMRRDALANSFNGMVLMAETNVWPIFVFLLISSYAGVGLLSSVIATASIFVTLYVGRRQETKGESHYIKRGLGAYSLTSLGRAIAENSFQIFGLNLLGGVGRSLYMTPYMNRYYTNSDGSFRLGYITVMETSFSIGSALYTLGLLALVSVFPIKTVLAGALAFVALAAAGVRLIR
jgi:hypothetical protein